jgi:glyoxylase-like metal-dependent hydrolase (beta-lactamase superfamily II)
MIVKESDVSKDSVKITVLADNEASEGLEKEHGFAAWVEVGSRHILFDTGHMGALQANAARLGINLKDADVLVISHGHRDHTGTLDRFLAENNHAELYFANQIDIERFWYKPDAAGGITTGIGGIACQPRPFNRCAALSRAGGRHNWPGTATEFV